MKKFNTLYVIVDMYVLLYLSYSSSLALIRLILQNVYRQLLLSSQIIKM